MKQSRKITFKSFKNGHSGNTSLQKKISKGIYVSSWQSWQVNK